MLAAARSSWPCSFNSVCPNMSLGDCPLPVTQQWLGLLHLRSYCWGRARTMLQVPPPPTHEGRGQGEMLFPQQEQ